MLRCRNLFPNQAFGIAKVTLTGGRRDKVFITLIFISVISFLAVIPAASSLSMRQVREVAVNLSLSTISFVSLVLTVFFGVHLIYRDMEQRFVHAVLPLPISRGSYLIGKFLGLSAILAIGLTILSLFSSIGILIASATYKSQIPMLWENYVAAVFFEYLELLILASFAVFFSSFSTTVFLPLFSTVSVYIIGNVTQSVAEYIASPYGQKLPRFSIYISKAVYYIFPNLTAFDLKAKAIYSLRMSFSDLSFIFLYAVLYILIILSASLLVFRRREIA